MGFCIWEIIVRFIPNSSRWFYIDLRSTMEVAINTDIVTCSFTFKESFMCSPILLCRLRFLLRSPHADIYNVSIGLFLGLYHCANWLWRIFVTLMWRPRSVVCFYTFFKNFGYLLSKCTFCSSLNAELTVDTFFVITQATSVYQFLHRPVKKIILQRTF